MDPLTAPEPSQDCGPGSSFINPLRRALSTSTKGTTRGKQPAAGLRHKSSSSYPTAPTPASPTQANHLRRKPVPLPPSTGSPHSPKLPLNRGNSLKKPGHHLEETHRPQGNSNIGRSKTVQSRRPPQTHQTQGASTLDRSTSPSTTDELHYKGKGLRRASSLGGRYPGDMSHRPLDQIRKEQRAADRAPHLKVQKYPNTDTIDGLDSTTFGGVYHHGGPYDATLASRNHIKKYSPVEAVKDSNEKALQATPREYIEDSLRKHVPLQGTSFVPPGFPAMSGQVMMYEEGSDLQREREALGGAYKRYDFIVRQPTTRDTGHHQILLNGLTGDLTYCITIRISILLHTYAKSPVSPFNKY